MFNIDCTHWKSNARVALESFFCTSCTNINWYFLTIVLKWSYYWWNSSLSKCKLFEFSEIYRVLVTIFGIWTAFWLNNELSNSDFSKLGLICTYNRHIQFLNHSVCSMIFLWIQRFLILRFLVNSIFLSTFGNFLCDLYQEFSVNSIIFLLFFIVYRQFNEISVNSMIFLYNWFQDFPMMIIFLHFVLVISLLLPISNKLISRKSISRKKGKNFEAFVV